MAVNIDPRLKLRHFALIVAIEETGSMRKAADRLNITQAAASNLLSELEDILGAPLFSRSRSGSRSTATGQILIDRARPILSNVRAAADEILQVREGEFGEVYVGVLHAAALSIVPLAIQLARRERPGITIHAIEGATRQHLDSLLHGDLDLVIGRVPLTQVSGLLHKEILHVDPIEVVCRADHRLAQLERVALKDVLDAEWILPEAGSSLREDFRATFLNAALQPPEPVIVTSSTVLRLTLIAESDMLGALPRRAALAQQARGSLKILDLGLMFRQAPTLLLYRADAILPAATTAFVDYVRSAAKLLSAEPDA